MADALVSGASVRKDVEVQLLSAAPAMRPLISSRDRRHGVPAISSRADRYEAGCRDQAPVARFRPEVDYLELLINENGRPYRNWGVDAMMDRLQESVGFRIHAHGFRHTFATVATQLGWNFERLRLAMGHEDYSAAL
jgi:integrase